MALCSCNIIISLFRVYSKDNFCVRLQLNEIASKPVWFKLAYIYGSCAHNLANFVWFESWFGLNSTEYLLAKWHHPPFIIGMVFDCLVKFVLDPTVMYLDTLIGRLVFYWVKTHQKYTWSHSSRNNTSIYYHLRPLHYLRQLHFLDLQHNHLLIQGFSLNKDFPSLPRHYLCN